MNRKAVFLDRDGVINVDHGYVHRQKDFQFIDGIFDACRHLQSLDYLLIVVTNQSGIARGLFSEKQFGVLTEWMVAQLAHQGIEIASVYYCPHHPDFGSRSKRQCDCRKPLPGMIDQAVEEFRLNRAACMMYGDSRRDMEAAMAARLGRRVLLDSSGQASAETILTADEVWRSHLDVVDRVPGD